MDEDEDSRLFLRMLDAAAERTFIGACSEIRAAETSAVSVVRSIEPTQRSLRSFRSTISPPSEGSSSRRKSVKRRKRSRTSDQPVLQQEFPARKISVGVDEKTRPSVGWPQNFTAHGYGVGKISDQPVWGTDFRLQRNSSNAGSVGYYGNSILPGAVLPPIVGIDDKSDTEDVEKSEDFSKEIHDAIGRIETLIPSLQKLVSFVQRPTDQKNVGSLDLQNDYSSSTLGDPPVNEQGKAKCWGVSRNKQDNAGNFREGRSVTSLASNHNARLIQAHQVKGNAKSFTKEFKGPNERFNEASTETGVTCLPAERVGRVKHEGIQTGISQVHGQNVRMDRVESLRRTSGRSESVTSRSPKHLLCLRNMPGCQCSRNVFNQKKATSKQALESDDASRYQTRVSSVGSSSFRRPNKSSKFDGFNYAASQSHARERRMQIREPVHRNSPRRKSPYSTSQNMITLQHQISEETNSPASRSGTSTQQSGYPTSLSGSYQSTDSYTTGSDESEGGYRKAHHQSGRSKWSGSSASYTDETSSHYSSQDQYSDTVTSSQVSSDRPHRREHHGEEGKRVGRISKLRKKLGTIFHHHHHHHHHHYSDKDEPDEGHTSFFKRLGNIFQRTGKTDHKRLKAEKSHEPVSKALVKKKQHGSHFRALLDGFTRHMKHTKKAKKAKDDIGRLASVRHRGKRAKKKPHLWPKMGKGKLKLPNKGKVKFGTRIKRPKFAAAKMILRQ